MTWDKNGFFYPVCMFVCFIQFVCAVKGKSFQALTNKSLVLWRCIIVKCWAHTQAHKKCAAQKWNSVKNCCWFLSYRLLCVSLGSSALQHFCKHRQGDFPRQQQHEKQQNAENIITEKKHKTDRNFIQHQIVVPTSDRALGPLLASIALSLAE